MKKVNACITWILILLFYSHLLVMSYSLATGWYNYNICKTLAWATGVVISIHAILSIIVVLFLHDGVKVSYYAKRNTQTIIQRATAIIILIFVHLHVKAFRFIVQGAHLSPADKIFILVTEFIFFGANFLHLTVSLSKSLITMGLLRSDDKEKLINKIVLVINVVLMCVATISLTLFIIKWK